MSASGTGAGTGAGPAQGIGGQDWNAVTGFAVFTSDEEDIGTVDSVIISPRDASQYYLKVNAAAAADLLGTDTLYVPDQDILSITADRIILNATTDTLSRPDWVTAPDESG